MGQTKFSKAKLMQNIRFRNRGNKFLANLKQEIRRISQQKNLIVSADKTSNNYLVPPEKYKKLLDKEIQKCYRKESKQNVQKINLEHKQTAAELDLEERIFHTTPKEAYITLKDHKPDFQTNPV